MKCMMVEVFKRTTDDWYPSYRINGWNAGVENQMLVEIRFCQLDNGSWRVSAWGGDDCGLERDFSSETDAWNVFQQVIGWNTVNRDQLINELHFVSA